MDTDDLFPFFAMMTVAALTLALRAWRTGRRLARDMAALTARVALLDHRVGGLAERFTPAGPTAVAPPAEAMPGPVVPDATAAAEMPPLPEMQPDELAAPVPPPPQARGWEQVLVEHWLVWLGGATLALGGAFLVKLSIDYGLLTPAVRVVLAVLLGIALSAGAEWVRRQERAEEDETSLPSYVPQALAAAGSAMVFAALYAAYGLYDLLPGSIAFILLALTCGATVAQSLRQGPLVAALGLVGAYAVPSLVSDNDPQAVALFAYLTVVTAGSLAVLRHRAWGWLAWLSLAGGYGWAVLWLGAAAAPETPVVAVYLLLQFAMFVAFRFGVPRIGFLDGMIDGPNIRALVRAAAWTTGFTLFVLACVDGFATTSLAAAVIAAVALLALAYYDSTIDDVIAPAGVLAVALLAAWHLPLPAPEMAMWVFRVEPDHVADFTIAAVIFTLLLGLGSYLLLPKVARPGRWAALSASVPLLVLVIAYWRLQKFELDIAWSLASLALAALELGAAATVASRRAGSRENEIALAAYAVGVLGSTIFAATLALSDAWLTVALAMHLPAMGWIEGKIRLKPLRWLAFGVASVVVVRLVLNPYVLDYPLGPTPVFNWLLYGYGVPATAFIAATRLFGSREDDALVWVLEAGGMLFSLALLTLEVIHASFSMLTAHVLDDFATFGALITLWLAFAAGCVALAEWRQRPVLFWGGMIIAAAATAAKMMWQPIMLIFGVRVGDWIVLDSLLWADGLPAAMYALIAWLMPSRPVVRLVLRTIARVFAALFAFWWVTLEINHFFNGKVSLFGGSSEAEWYAYSVAWLAFAGTTLALGLVWRNQWLRRAGLIGIALVVAKVFLSDMAELSGVLRALSFMGLGGALIGLGYAYRRLRPLQAP